MELDFLPEHLIIIGGSYIGLEFAQMYRRFGSDVTVIEKASGIIQREDEVFQPYTHFGGEEIVVISGKFIDEHGEYPEGHTGTLWTKMPYWQALPKWGSYS
ncbi:MAG: hypothetical protein GQ549_03355 [Gammaproteobacteria bacterium]|nr:hypothetical protein [Gammaproteobacteria bacterium]